MRPEPPATACPAAPLVVPVGPNGQSSLDATTHAHTDGRLGILLFAHGARDATWAQPFEAVAALVRAQRPDCTVTLAFLEFMAPTMTEAAAAMIAAGCSRLDIVPLFLGTGGHVRRDVPVLIAELQAAHRGVGFSLHAAIGEQPAVIAAMAAAAAFPGGPSS